MVAAGLVLLLRRRRGNATGLAEAAIVAIGLGLAFWVFVLHPVAAESATSALERWISTTYPAADVLLLVMLARLFTSPGGRTASIRLIAAAVVLVLAADTAFSLVSLYWNADLPVINAGFLLAYLCWAAAALHPSMAAPALDAAADHRPLRLVVFGGVTMIAPALLLVPWVGHDAIDRRALSTGSILLFLLVTVRMAHFMRTLRRLAMSDDLTGLANRRSLEQALRDASPAARPQV